VEKTQQKERKKILKKDAKVLYPTWKFLICKARWKRYELEEVILRRGKKYRAS
jgi:hypothetical protein